MITLHLSRFNLQATVGHHAPWEIGFDAPHQTLWDLFGGVRPSGGGYHISQLVNK